ncbi:MAG TPA: hypothetical protein VNH11_17480 [Pirellulales bacterium]|nr:hypothetical protein [Pirellulales bacterium]
MAGYRIYSLGWDKFQNFVSNPTKKQLTAFAKRVSEQLAGGEDDDDDDYGDDDEEGADPVREWPTEPDALRKFVKERLARPDWYGDLSDGGKDAWSCAVCYFCEEEGPGGVGFRVDHDGIYWDLLELAWKMLKIPGEEIHPDVALSAFGRRPYRYTPAATDGSEEDEDDYDAWQPMHSMHTPDEVRKMLAELESIAPAVEGAKNKQAINDYDALVPVLERLAEEGRMLFIQVDT